MARHARSTPMQVLGAGKRREMSVTQHQGFIDEMRETYFAIEANRCPNDDQHLLRSGHCSKRGCPFRLTIVRPPPISHRVPFNRRWVPGVKGQSG